MINIIDYSGMDEEYHKDKPDYLKNLTWQEVVKFGKRLEKDAIKDEETYSLTIEVL